MNLEAKAKNTQKYVDTGFGIRQTLIYIPDTPLDRVGFLTPMCLHRYKDSVKYWKKYVGLGIRVLDSTVVVTLSQCSCNFEPM